MAPAPAPAPAERWVALLRGVNVNGVTVKSAELAAMMGSLGYEAVKTVLASGNILFSAPGTTPGSPRDAAVLKADIERALGETFGYDAWIILTSQGPLAAIVDAYPWPEVPELQPYVIFGSEQAPLDALLAFSETGEGEPEHVVRGEGVLYWEVPKGQSTDTKLAKEAAKVRYRSTTTTRNLRTLRKLLP